LALGQAAHSEVRLARVPVFEQMLIPASEGFGVLWPNQSYEQTLCAAHDYLERLIAAQPTSAATLTQVVLEGEGDVAHAIVEAAATAPADLIVLSTHGYSGVTRWVLGSVAERVLHQAPCPVCVVRAAAVPRRVLIPLDGSAVAETVLAPALALAAQLDDTVTLLRAVPMVSTSEVRRLNALEPNLGARLQEELCADAAHYLRRVAATHARPQTRLDTHVLIGPAAHTILQYAEQKNYDLIAMATHGRTGLQRWTYGSVTEKVLRSASCSMLVVRPKTSALN
jgi:nucleotide-binding universal stress UspA family protein